MVTDVRFWIVLVLAVAAIVALAIRYGNNVVVRFKDFSFRTSDKKLKDAQLSNVRVGEEAEVQGNVGRVIGKSFGQSEFHDGNVDVGKKMKIGGSVKEIIGIETTGKKTKP